MADVVKKIIEANDLKNASSIVGVDRVGNIQATSMVFDGSGINVSLNDISVGTKVLQSTGAFSVSGTSGSGVLVALETRLTGRFDDNDYYSA
jgi:LEA14-like dessication related protein